MGIMATTMRPQIIPSMNHANVVNRNNASREISSSIPRKALVSEDLMIFSHLEL